MNIFCLAVNPGQGLRRYRKEFRAVDGAIVTHWPGCLSASSRTNMQSLTATHGDLMMISKKGKSLLGLLFLYFPPFENVYNPRHTQSYSIAGLMPYEHTMNRDSQCCSTCRKKMCRAILLSKSGNA